MTALRQYTGVGLIVSHDRELLDTFCQQCLYLEPPLATMRPGGYSRGSEQARREQQSAREAQSRAKRARERLQREAVRRRGEASRADRRRSKRGLDRKDSDARAKIDVARVSGRDGMAGRKLRQLEGRLRQLSQSAQQTQLKKQKKLGIWLPGSTSTRNSLFSIAKGTLPLGASGRLSYPDLSMAPTDRIAITGPNGSGKSTLIQHIVDSLNLPKDRVTYVPQEISREKSVRAMISVRQLAHERLGHLMTVVSCLGSEPQRVLETSEPSPGEMRKVLLGIGIGHCPHLIIMDEPTNHLDLPSIECLERALADCPCGLLLVSHDERFLASLTRTRWRITVSGSPDALDAELCAR
jgi:ATPase subunit of ABC transporter with duplicated ATPase domains